MFCGKCGAQLPDHATFCSQCGNPVKETVSPSGTIQKKGTKTAVIFLVAICILLIGVIFVLLALGRARERLEDEKAKWVPKVENRIEIEVIEQPKIERLYGTWENISGSFCISFYEDKTVRIATGGNLLGAELFTFSELDSNTLSLKAVTDNVIVDLFSLSLNYEISGDVLKIELLDKKYELRKTE